ncbi:MAG: hypothetical protein U0794_16505 [Isosphaeraceae bacterium]
MTEPPPEVVEEFSVVGEESQLLLPHGFQSDPRSDGRMSVAIAADPRPEAQERRNFPASVGKDPFEAILDLAIEPGYDVEEAPLDELGPLSDLVDDCGPGRPDRVGEPERLDLLGNRREDVVALTGKGAALFQLIEAAGDLGKFFEDGSTTRLARMRCEDRTDHRAFEMLGNLLGVDPFFLELLERGFGGLREQRGPRAQSPLAQRTNASTLLGQVDEVEIDAERADKGAERGQLQPRKLVAQPTRQRDFRGAAKFLRGCAHFLDELIGLVARESADRLTEEIAEQVDV